MVSGNATKRGVVAGAVRPDGHLPLALRPADARSERPVRPDGDPLLPHGRPLLAQHDEVLDAAVRHQLRHRRSHGTDSRIRVRHQLVELLQLRGRHLRCAAGHRGDHGLLPRIDLRGGDVLRLGQGEPRLPPLGHVAHGHRRQPFGAVDSGGQQLDAVSRRMFVQHRHGAQRDGFVLGRTLLSRGDQQVLAYGHLVVPPGGDLRHGRERVVPAARTPPPHGAQQHRAGVGLQAGLRPRGGLFGRPLGCDRGARAADEAGGHGGALRRRGGGAADGGGPAAPRRAAHLRRRRLLLQDRHPQAPLADEFPLGRRLRAGDQRSGLRQRGAGYPFHGRENVARTPCDRPAGPLSRSARKGRRSRDARGRTAFRRLDARRGGLPARLLRLLRLRLSPLAPGDGAQRAAGLLFVPRHGRCRLFLHPALCRRVVAQPPRPARRQTLAAAGDDPVDPAGLPRLAGGLDRRRSGTPAVDDPEPAACLRVGGSHIAATPVAVTFFIFLALFTVLLAAELAIMLRQIKIGPNE